MRACKRQHMRYLDWRRLSLIGYLIGGVSILVGLYMYLYYGTTLIGWIGLTFYSYKNYAIPLIIAGLVILIMGYVTEQRGRKKIKGVEKLQPIANRGVCPNCGAKRDLDAQYYNKSRKKDSSP